MMKRLLAMSLRLCPRRLTISPQGTCVQSRALRGWNPSTNIAPAGILNSVRLYSRRRRVYSRLPFNLATGLSVVVIGSVLYYVGTKRGGRKRAGTVSSTGRGSASSGIEGKSVLITGAAGDIGGATATAFACKGATVILVDLPSTHDQLEKKCKELMAKGARKAVFKTADVTRVEDVEQMTEFAVANAGRIDCFFNNAGVQGEFQPLHKQSNESFRKVMNVNIYGAFLGMKYVSQAMIESGGGGVIVNTASLAGIIGPPNMGAYTASKHAVVGMTKTAAKDLAPHHIRVCAISPGILEGKMWYSQVKGQAECRKRLAGDNTDVTTEELKEMEQRKIDGTPMKRLGQLSEVASVVVFLCSDEASYLTGTVVPIDGGRLQ